MSFVKDFYLENTYDVEDRFILEKKTFIRKIIVESILLEIFLISLFFKWFFIDY